MPCGGIAGAICWGAPGGGGGGGEMEGLPEPREVSQQGSDCVWDWPLDVHGLGVFLIVLISPGRGR